MTDPALTACEDCGGTVKKVLYPVGIAFKGSGFYVNDYAKPAAAANGAGSSETTDAKPAAEPKTETNAPAAPATSANPTPAPAATETTPAVKT